MWAWFRNGQKKSRAIIYLSTPSTGRPGSAPDTHSHTVTHYQRLFSCPDFRVQVQYNFKFPLTHDHLLIYLLSGTRDSLPISASKLGISLNLGSRSGYRVAKQFQRSKVRHTHNSAHSSSHSIPFQSSPVQSIPPFHSTVPVH